MSAPARRVVAGSALPPEPGVDGFVRTAVTFGEAKGQRIRGLLVEPGGERHGTVLVAPGFGRTIRHSTVFALHLARHGYGSLRVDLTNHTGDSDGDIVHGSLSSAVDDLWRVLDGWEHTGQTSPRYLMASSLSARSAVRAVAEGLPVDGVVLVLPVVDLGRTIAVVTGEDLVAGYLDGRIGVEDPLTVSTHEMSGRFLADAVHGGFLGLETTRDEIARIDRPVAAVAAERDEWVDAGDITVALGADTDASRQVFVLERASHDSYDFGFLRAVTRTVVQALAAMSGVVPGAEHHIDYSELANALTGDKVVLRRARQIWRGEDG